MYVLYIYSMQYVCASTACGVCCGVLYGVSVCVLVAVGSQSSRLCVVRRVVVRGMNELWLGRCKLNYLFDWWESNEKAAADIYIYIYIHIQYMETIIQPSGLVIVSLALSRRLSRRQSCTLVYS